MEKLASPISLSLEDLDALTENKVERQRDRKTERQRETERDRDRQADRQTDICELTRTHKRQLLCNAAGELDKAGFEHVMRVQIQLFVQVRSAGARRQEGGRRVRAR